MISILVGTFFNSKMCVFTRSPYSAQEGCERSPEVLRFLVILEDTGMDILSKFCVNLPLSLLPDLSGTVITNLNNSHSKSQQAELAN